MKLRYRPGGLRPRTPCGGRMIAFKWPGLHPPPPKKIAMKKKIFPCCLTDSPPRNKILGTPLVSFYLYGFKQCKSGGQFSNYYCLRFWHLLELPWPLHPPYSSPHPFPITYSTSLCQVFQQYFTFVLICYVKISTSYLICQFIIDPHSHYQCKQNYMVLLPFSPHSESAIIQNSMVAHTTPKRFWSAPL